MSTLPTIADHHPLWRFRPSSLCPFLISTTISLLRHNPFHHSNHKQIKMLSAVVFFLLSTLSALSPSHATGFVAPVWKDPTTLLYSLPVYLKTPPQLNHLHLDLGASFTWIDCDKNYTSSTSQHISCGTPLCNSMPGPTCSTKNKCALSPENPVTRKSATSVAITDSLRLIETDGSASGKIRTLPRYLFSCSPGFLRQGLAAKSAGVAAFGRSNYSLPAQVSRGFSVPNYFALCLSSSTSAPGVIFVGSSGPYHFRGSQETDLSRSLGYTPLILNPVGSTVVNYHGKPSDEYFIGLTSIKVSGEPLPIKAKLLAIDGKTGIGGTKISTSTPYAVLETSIYKALTAAFMKGTVIKPITPLKPFTVCYSAADVPMTGFGPVMPMIDLVMHHPDVFWRLYGGNSMVRVKNKGVDAWCLGFVDGGVNPRTSVVIGGLQMEENLLQFDLESKRMGFGSALLRNTRCANFNFSKKK